METLIHYLHKQLPAFWGLLLTIPFVKDYLPELYAFINTSDLNAFIAIAAWILLFEILIFHILSPLLIIFIASLGVYLASYITTIKIFPSIIKKSNHQTITLSPLKLLAIELVKKRLKSDIEIKDRLAEQIAIKAGASSKYYNEDIFDRDEEVFVFLGMTSFIGAAFYYWLEPNLSIIGIEPITASIILSLSSAFLFVLAWTIGGEDKKSKLKAAILFLTDKTTES